MSIVWPAPQLFFAVVEPDVVVLDIAADRYECLSQAADWLQVREDRSLQVADAPMRQALIDAGLASHIPPPRPLKSVAPPDAELDPAAGGALAAIMRAGVSQAASGLRFRRLDLAELTAPLEVRPERGLSAADVAAFKSASAWIPFEGECLDRAYKLRRYLHALGVPVDWIFGVRTWPFAAHCWVQLGSQVVGDNLERVRRYTPIAAF